MIVCALLMSVNMEIAGDLQNNAAQGRDPQSTPLHVCQCPSCFTAFAKSNGVIECVPKCDLANCDESTGVCSEAGSKGDTTELVSLSNQLCRGSALQVEGNMQWYAQGLLFWWANRTQCQALSAVKCYKLVSSLQPSVPHHLHEV